MGVVFGTTVFFVNRSMHSASLRQTLSKTNCSSETVIFQATQHGTDPNWRVDSKVQPLGEQGRGWASFVMRDSDIV